MSNDPEQDKRVSDTYRSLASEKVPPHLDRMVLDMAAAERKRPLYARWMSWTRPLAWAATITLCLAITLELSQDQSLDPTLLEPTHLTPSPQRPADEARNVASPAALPPQEKLEQDQVLAESMNDEIIAEKTALARSAAKQPASEPVTARIRQPVAAMEEEKEKSTDANLRAEAGFSSYAIAKYSRSDSDNAADECPDDARSDAESWLECIQALEAAGDNEAALRQRDALKETFPDFKLP